MKGDNINSTCQLTLPDIHLKDADRVFRLYVKSFHDKAAYRSEESLTTDRMLLKEALDNIRYPYKSIASAIEQIKNQVDKIDRKIDGITSPAKASNNNTNDQDLPASGEGSDNLTSNRG